MPSSGTPRSSTVGLGQPLEAADDVVRRGSRPCRRSAAAGRGSRGVLQRRDRLAQGDHRVAVGRHADRRLPEPVRLRRPARSGWRGCGRRRTSSATRRRRARRTPAGTCPGRRRACGRRRPGSRRRQQPPDDGDDPPVRASARNAAQVRPGDAEREVGRHERRRRAPRRPDRHRVRPDHGRQLAAGRSRCGSRCGRRRRPGRPRPAARRRRSPARPRGPTARGPRCRP